LLYFFLRLFSSLFPETVPIPANGREVDDDWRNRFPGGESTTPAIPVGDLKTGRCGYLLYYKTFKSFQTPPTPGFDKIFINLTEIFLDIRSDPLHPPLVFRYLLYKYCKMRRVS